MDAEPLLKLAGPTKGVVDYRGRPISRSATGGWTAAFFVIGMEVAERCANAGIASNLITYLTGPLGESTAAAAAKVNAWSGTGSMLPLLGAFVADSYLGRYWTIVISSLLYLLGLVMLMLSAMLPALYPPKCSGTADTTACPPTQLQVAIFHFSLYLVAIGQGGFKPCIEAFGADQFDENDPEECKAKSSFFNWWFFGMCSGATATTFVVNYVQDNISWALSFGMVCIFMGLAIIVFLLGSRTYRYYEVEDNRIIAGAMKACRALISSGRISSRAKLKDDETQFVSPKSTNEAREEIFPHATDHSM
ncbi:putative protein NRT1/ PTR FAMILY 5.10 [Cocos nucifera]|uniref:Uncharacterized protein n=1 Tax=Cocos nucifera TaxID=13894 RepID=A0A8K0IXH7_COCNU|nr:putative protein NRT1/ PTR FAMILY 5.10 [Cocos nucifera]